LAVAVKSTNWRKKRRGPKWKVLSRAAVSSGWGSVTTKTKKWQKDQIRLDRPKKKKYVECMGSRERKRDAHHRGRIKRHQKRGTKEGRT